MAGKQINLTFMWPPTVNSYWILVRRGKHCSKILSKKGELYKQHVYEECVKQLGQWEPIEGKIKFTLSAHPPDRRRRDLDNIFKSLLDAMEDAHLFKDDCQVCIINATKLDFNQLSKNMVQITLEEIS
jgi:crossover junction endodeoxyribonuclease RusA